MWRATDVPQNMCHKSRGGENLLVILGKIENFGVLLDHAMMFICHSYVNKVE